MYCTKSILTIIAASAVANAGLVSRAVPNIDDSDVNVVGRTIASGGNSNDCPAIWTSIAAALKPSLLNSTTGQCTAIARQTIRMAFHDCGAWNLTFGETLGCDGSLITENEVNLRSENVGMSEGAALLAALVVQFDNQISTADMIQFAAASSIQLCPLGPTVQTFVGRKDSFTPAPMNLLPLPSQNASFLFDLFSAKGIDAPTLAALLGAHTVSQQFFVDPALAGEPQDTTPGIWDVGIYAQTLSQPAGIFSFHSDVVLAQDEVFGVGQQWQGFVNNQGKWNGKFATSMTELSLLGVPGGSTDLIDCTAALPSA